jgi:hypothetical protein
MKTLGINRDLTERKVNPENEGLFISCKHLFPLFLKEIEKVGDRIRKKKQNK